MSLVPDHIYPAPGPYNIDAIEVHPERANVYALSLDVMPEQLYLVRADVAGKVVENIYLGKVPGSKMVEPGISNMKRALTTSLVSGLAQNGYRLSDRSEMIIDTDTQYNSGHRSLQIHPAFRLRVMYFNGRYYLCLNHQLSIRSVLSLAEISEASESFVANPSQRVYYRSDEGWQEAHFLRSDGGGFLLTATTGDEVLLAPEDVVPRLSRGQVASLAPALGINARDLEQRMKDLSLLTRANAPRERLVASTNFAAKLAKSVFPLATLGPTIDLNPNPAILCPPMFNLRKDLNEASVAFDHADQTKRAKDIADGLTRIGAYQKPVEEIRLLVICTKSREPLMNRLIERLNRGSYSYQGAKKTFGGNFVVGERLIGMTVSDNDDLIRKFVRSSQRDEVNVALVYLPKAEADMHDPDHPYFRVKGQLLREGIASQMVDEATLQNPNWRDLNIALNVFAKSGYVPWVLDEELEGVDLFIGLSSSQIRHGNQTIRMMGYVNVFDSYGRWRFYQGDSLAFRFEDRLRHYGDLVRNSVASFEVENGGKIGVVHIHLTKHFSAEERSVLAAAVHEVAPGATVVFVWINPHHLFRMYDLSHADGQINRATYLLDEPGRLYLATTGHNVFNQKGMGTPVPLELTIWTDPQDVKISLTTVGQQILSLTRLNWGSSRSFCQEPITTKFAGDIARKMTAFMQDPSFSVAARLRDKPWFL